MGDKGNASAHKQYAGVAIGGLAVLMTVVMLLGALLDIKRMMLVGIVAAVCCKHYNRQSQSACRFL